MKHFICLVLFAFLGASALLADDFSDQVSKAQSLKKQGKYEEAAKVHPRSLCSAIYYWNAACQIVGHRDSNGDWAINSNLTGDQKKEGLRLLELASSKLAEAEQIATQENKSGDDGTCKGVDADTLKELIEKVTACINGNCK